MVIFNSYVKLPAMLAQFLSGPQYVIIWFIKPMNTILVGGLEHFLFFQILGISSSQLTNSYFQRGRRKTTNHYIYIYIIYIYIIAIDHIVKLSTHLAPTLLHPLQGFQGCFRDVRSDFLPRNHIGPYYGRSLAPPNRRLKADQSWDVYHLSTGAGFRVAIHSRLRMVDG